MISESAAGPSGGFVDLDQVQSDVAADVATDVTRRSFAVLAKGGFNRPDENFPSGTFVELYRVTGTTEVSRAAFALSGKVTRLELSGENLDTAFFQYVRETSVYAKSELMPLAQRPVTAAVSGDRIAVNAAADGLLPGRRLIVRGTRANDGQTVVVQATLVAAHTVDDRRAELEITPPLADALMRDSVVVHANVALGSHGEIGHPDPRRRQCQPELSALRAEAAAADLSRRRQRDRRRPRSSTVRVNDVAWRSSRRCMAPRPTDRAYTLETDEQGRMFVAFGDGARGARLPSGVNNVRATYRKGSGHRRQCRRRQSDAADDAAARAEERQQSARGRGRHRPRAGQCRTRDDSARRRARSGRAVSVLDYEDFARAFTGIAKAQAQVLQVPWRRHRRDHAGGAGGRTADTAPARSG